MVEKSTSFTRTRSSNLFLKQGMSGNQGCYCLITNTSWKFRSRIWSLDVHHTAWSREYFGLVGLTVHSAKNQNQLNMFYNSVFGTVPVPCKKQGSFLARYGQYCDRIGENVRVSSPCSSSLPRAIQRGERVADADVPASNRSARLPSWHF